MKTPKLKCLLLENIHPIAKHNFEKEGIEVESLKETFNTDELKEKVKDVHILGIRSKTKIVPEILDAAPNLMAVGCFCIGTDQVDLEACEERGIPVFNSPFANTRSVAELCLAEIIMLARRMGDRSMEMHNGEFNKTANGCHEIRGKVLGIVGYGHVGSQLAILAEACGMRVQYYDIVEKLPLGNAKPCSSLNEVLMTSDFVSLHVPKTPLTKMMIGEKEIKMMKKGSYLINSCRGDVVDVHALAAALKSGHLAGAAVDVHPNEPTGNGKGFKSPLQGCPNTILTPHIGASTQEAQEKIGEEASRALIGFIKSGRTMGAVNFPNLHMKRYTSARLLHIHKNKPGVLKNINAVLQDYNVEGQTLGTTKNIGFVIIDVDKEVSETIFEEIKKLDGTIKTRLVSY